MTAVVGSLAIELLANNTKLEKGLQAAGYDVSRFEDRSKKSLGRMDRTFSGRFASMGRSAMQFAATLGRMGGAIGVGTAASIAVTRKAAAAILEVGDAARRAGVDVESFSELRYVAEQNRIGIDSLTDGLKELNLRADEFVITGKGSAAEAFQRLGYDADTLKEKLKDPSALFTEIIGKLGQLDKSAQIRIADEIFGGTGGEKFVQLIEQGEFGIKRAMQEAHDLGVVINSELVVKAGELETAFNNVTAAVSSGLHQAIVNASWALYDFLQQFTQVENRTTSSLENTMRELGAERVRVENEMLRLQAEQLKNNAATGPLADAGILASLDADGLKEQRIRLEEIAQEERRILEVLNRRTPIIEPGNSTPPIVATSTSSEKTREETDAVHKHILALRDELSLIGQAEAQKRIINELRAAGVSLASDEGQAIAQLVTQIEAENEAQAALQETIEGASSMTKDFVSGLISDMRDGVSATEALSNAFGRLNDRLLDMALDAAINKLIGGLFGSISSTGSGYTPGFGAFGHFADGGRISGPGTGVSDSIPVMASNGEYIVNAQSTRKFLPLLEMINSGAGQFRSFAAGGYVGSMDLPDMSSSRDGLKVEIYNEGGEKVEAKSASMSRDGSSEIVKIILGAVNQAAGEGKLRGLEKVYGLTPKGY